MMRPLPILLLGTMVAGAGRVSRAQTADTLALSMADAVARALRYGDEARLAAAQSDIAGARLGIARAAALPQLRFAGTYTHVAENARAQAVGSIFNQPNTYGANVNLSQPIFQGGRAIAGIRAASAVREAADLTETETRAQVSLDVGSAYVQALLAERILQIRTSSYDLADARLRQVEQLQAAGRAARYDVLRARVERANLEPLVVQSRSDRDIALLTVKRLSNVPLDRPVALTTSLDGSAVSALASELERARDDGGRRDLVRAAELTSKAQRAGVAIARADLLPTVSVFVQSGYGAFPLGNSFPTGRGAFETTSCPTQDDPSRLCRQQNGGWFADRSAGVSVSWSLFDGLRTKAAIDLAAAQARSADAQLSQTREAVALQVAQARAELRRARSLQGARHENAAEAAEAFQLASLRFARGLGTQLEVSDAQLALLTAQTDEARATYDLYLATAALARALGRPVPLPASASDGTSGGR